MPSTLTVEEHQCPWCKKSFPIEKLFKHQKNAHPKCFYCRKRFQTADHLRTHQKATTHCYCRECDKAFQTLRLHVLHAREVSHSQQYRCCDCKREYIDQHSLTTHCCVCDRSFKSKDSLYDHITFCQSHKARARKLKPQPNPSSRQHKCSRCNRGFQTELALKAHARAKHNLPCPMGTECNRKFATPSALFDHLESGACKSKMNRQKLNELVVFHDKNHHITDVDAARSISQQYIEQHSTSQSTFVLTPQNTDENESYPCSPLDEDSFSDSDDYDVIGGVLLTPTAWDSHSEWSIIPTPQLRSVDSISDMASIAQLSQHEPSPQKLRCLLCPRNFVSLTALQMHLNSAKHAPKIFHCPMAFTPTPLDYLSRQKQEKRFSTLSGLTRHLESGACSGGFKTFQNAIKYVEEQLSRLGLNGLKLMVEPALASKTAAAVPGRGGGSGAVNLK